MMSRFAYVGSYGPPDGKGTGITVYRLDPDIPGKFLEPSLQTIANPSPSFLCVNRSGSRLYAVNELNEYGGQVGAVTAFRIDPDTGLLSELNARSARGYQPCHVTFDPSETHLLIANYGTGSVLVCPVSSDDGSLAVEGDGRDQLFQHDQACGGPNKSRQEGPHAHMIYFLKDDQVLVPDLGQDRVLIYEYDSKQVSGRRLIPSKKVFKLTPGSGPRHVVATSDGRFLFVINELNSTMSVFSTSLEDGECFRLLQTISTLPTSATDIPDKVLKGDVSSGCAAVRLHPTGKFLYGSNRGHDSIVVFAVDGSSGLLTPVGHQKTLGRTPRHFDIDRSGTILFAANQDSDNIVTFRIHSDTGLLTPTGDVIEIPSPVSIVFV